MHHCLINTNASERIYSSESELLLIDLILLNKIKDHLLLWSASSNFLAPSFITRSLSTMMVFCRKRKVRGYNRWFPLLYSVHKHSLELDDKSLKDLYYVFHKSVEPIKLEIFETFLVLIIKSITLPLKPPDNKRYSIPTRLNSEI